MLSVLSFFVHSTEDEERVTSSVERMLGVGVNELEKREIKGQYDNIIKVYTGSFKGRKAESLLLRIARGLEGSSRSYLSRNITQFIDHQGRLYIRLDKQELVLGRLVLGSRDPIKITFKAVGLKRGSAVERFKDVFTQPT